MVERIVIESLFEEGKNRHQLFVDTKLDIELLKNILCDLEKEDLILCKKGCYYLNKNKMSEMSDKKQMKNELKELFIAWVNKFFLEEKKKTTCLKVKKVYMNDSEELLYNEHLNKLNRFIEQIKEMSKLENRGCSTAKKKIIFWGHEEYKELVDASLSVF